MCTTTGTRAPAAGDTRELFRSVCVGPCALIPGGVDGRRGLSTTDGLVVWVGAPAGPGDGDGGTERGNGEACVGNDARFEDATRSRYADTPRNVTTVTTAKKRKAPRAIWRIVGRREPRP